MKSSSTHGNSIKVVAALALACFTGVACSTDEGGKRSTQSASPAAATAQVQGQRQNSSDGTGGTALGERLSSGDDHVVVVKRPASANQVAAASAPNASQPQLGLLACSTESEYGSQESAADAEARAQNCDKSVKGAATSQK